MSASSTDPALVLGARIRTRRDELELSLEKAAPRCGVHWSALGAIERGQRNPSVMTLLKIAAGLEIDPARLVEGLVPPPS